MKLTHSKDTIVFLFLAAAVIILGEGIFRWGGYWVFVLLLAGHGKVSYWWGFILGILVSLFTGSLLGLVSIFVIIVMGIYGTFSLSIRNNPWIIFVLAVIINLTTDQVLKLGWSPFEILGTFCLIIFLAVLGYFNEDLKLKRL